ncbi:MAG TPA: hypothetical protein DD670_16130 [Planctomycetaceae bacterium]|nr:hypothetical protein [Planctomycetaceae bacterium]
MAEKKQTTTIALVVFLGIALAGILLVQFDVLSFSPAKATAPGASAAGASNANPPATTAAQTLGPAWERPGPVRLGLRDPMQLDAAKLPPAPASATSSSPETAVPKPVFLVTGIVFNKEQSSSIIIDGQILYEGSAIHGATVVKITEQYAEMSRGDKTWQVWPGQSNPEPE